MEAAEILRLRAELQQREARFFARFGAAASPAAASAPTAAPVAASGPASATTGAHPNFLAALDMSAPERMRDIFRSKPGHPFTVEALREALPDLDAKLVRSTAHRMSGAKGGFPGVQRIGRGLYRYQPPVGTRIITSSGVVVGATAGGPGGSFLTGSGVSVGGAKTQ